MPVKVEVLENKKPTEEEVVVAAVSKEIQKLGDNTKKNFEELNTRYKELQTKIDGIEDQQDKNQVEKLATDISLRKDALDKEAAIRKAELDTKLDAIENALKRPGQGKSECTDKEQKDYEGFVIAALSARDKGTSIQDIDKNAIPYETYEQYKKAVVKLFRHGGNDSFLSMDERKVLSVGIDPHGGYTVTPAMSNRIIQKIYESDPIRQLASVESITTSELEYMVDVDEAGAGWEGETETGSETDTPDFAMKKIPVYTMYAKPKATRMLIEDSGINIETWLANKVGARFSRIEAAAFVSADGTNKPRGFLKYSSGTTHKTVEQIDMGHASLLTADGYIKVKYSLVEEFLSVGTWLMNRLTVRDTMLLKYGDGQYIWKPSLIAADPISTILGLPVRMSTTMPTVTDDALAVVLADFSNAYAIVDRLGITVEPDPFTKKPFIEYYTRKRVGGGSINGQAMKIGKIST